MFIKEDNTYNDIREKSLLQWLEEMEQHEDVAVRSGVRLCREYMQYLKEQNKRLEEISLRVPQITKIMAELKDKGFEFSDGILTVEQALEEILTLLKKEGKVW